MRRGSRLRIGWERAERLVCALISDQYYQTLRNCSNFFKDDESCCRLEGLLSAKYPFKYVEIMFDSPHYDEGDAKGGSFVSSEESVSVVNNVSRRLAVELHLAEEELFMFILRNDMLSPDYLRNGRVMVKFIGDQWKSIMKVTKDNPEKSIEVLWSLHGDRRHSSYATSIHSSSLLRQMWYFGNVSKDVAKYIPSLLCEVLKPTYTIGDKRPINAFNMYM